MVFDPKADGLDKHEAMLEHILSKQMELSPWESDFITSLQENGIKTDKQKTKLDEIFERLYE